MTISSQTHRSQPRPRRTASRAVAATRCVGFSTPRRRCSRGEGAGGRSSRRVSPRRQGSGASVGSSWLLYFRRQGARSRRRRHLALPLLRPLVTDSIAEVRGGRMPGDPLADPVRAVLESPSSAGFRGRCSGYPVRCVCCSARMQHRATIRDVTRPLRMEVGRTARSVLLAVHWPHGGAGIVSESLRRGDCSCSPGDGAASREAVRLRPRRAIHPTVLRGGPRDGSRHILHLPLGRAQGEGEQGR